MPRNEIYGFSRPYESYEHDINEHACSSHEHMDSNLYFSAEEVVYDDQNQKDNRRPCMIRWKSGKRVDPRLLTVLESFREVYVERRDFFKRIFPGAYDEFVDVFKKFGEMVSKNKEMRSGTMTRSLSFGSLHAVGHNDEEEEEEQEQEEWSDEQRLEKFKVRTPVVIVAGSRGKDNKTK